MFDTFFFVFFLKKEVSVFKLSVNLRFIYVFFPGYKSAMFAVAYMVWYAFFSAELK